jgi:hypothetical protein
MTYVDLNKIGLVYHMGKNCVKASEARDKELGNGGDDNLPETNL